MILNILNKLKWRLIIAFILYSCVSIATFQVLYTDLTPSYVDIIFNQLNEESILCFALMFIFLVVIGDINMNKLNSVDFKNIIIYIIICSGLLVVLYCVANIITYAIISGNSFNFTESILVTQNPLELLGLSLLFVFLRIIFSGMLIMLINCFSKQSFGFISILIISLIDWMFYSLFRINYPLGILPIEHTKAIYTEAFLPNIRELPRVSYLASIIYWLVLILILVFILSKRYNNDEDNE